LPRWLSLTPSWRPRGILAWVFGEWALRGKPSLLGACSGAIAGLVGVTPACGYIGVGGALIVGIASGLAGLWGVTALKRWLRVDDPCDVFGVHGVCGIVGCILTGIFAATSLGGGLCGRRHHGPSGAGTAGKYRHHRRLVRRCRLHRLQSGGYDRGLRVPEEQEREGLDVNSHGENAYNA
jgi:Amt family ammonium transporter